MVRRLTAGAEWIRTFSPALDRQRFVGFVRVGADLPAHRSSEQLPASAYRSICRGGGPRPPLTARIRRHHHVSAIGGASASRNRRFESVPLQQRVCEPSVPQLQRFIGLRQRKQLLIEHLERWLSPSRIEGDAPRTLPPNAAGDQRARLSPSNPIRMSSVGLRMCWTCAAKSRVCPTHCRADIPRQLTQTARRVDSGRLIDRLA
jgi:hypothetical protein